MIISFVVAADENNGIGKNNRLLCHLPADLKFFKQNTVGHPIIMGRKTFDSIGKPLPKRRNIIVTHQDLSITGAEIAHSLPEAIELCTGEKKVSIVGGATLYKQGLEFANTIFLTRIHHTFEADTFLPEIDWTQWEEISQEYHPADDENAFDFTFYTYKKLL